MLRWDERHLFSILCFLFPSIPVHTYQVVFCIDRLKKLPRTCGAKVSGKYSVTILKEKWGRQVS